jgi:hypothetical protein
VTHLSVTKVVVKVNRRGIRAPECLQRFDSSPIPMITNRQLALLMADSLPKALSDSCTTPGGARSWSPFTLVPSLRAEDGLRAKRLGFSKNRPFDRELKKRGRTRRIRDTSYEWCIETQRFHHTDPCRYFGGYAEMAAWTCFQ